MGFMTTILEKTVILCAQVYLLVIMLMILGLRWWQMMAMKDFQIWVLATCSLPSMPALDMLDEPFPAHLFQPCSTAVTLVPGCMTERSGSLSQGKSAPLISNATPRQSCCGSRGNHSGYKELEGLGCHLNSSHAALKFLHLLSLPVLLSLSCFHPHTRENLRMPESAQKVKLWSNSQDFGWKICKGCNVQSPFLTPWVRVTSTWLSHKKVPDPLGVF